MFADLDWWDRAEAALGEEAASQLVSRATRLIQDATLEATGRVVKVIGEEVEALFPDALQAASASIAMQRAVAAMASPVGSRLKICFAWGEVRFEDDGDVFGDIVGFAARGSRQGESAGRIVLTGEALQRLEPARRSACRLVDSLTRPNGAKFEYYEMPWK